MKTIINTTVSGIYTIENDKGEILAQASNQITDLGMTAIAGHPITSDINYPTGANGKCFPAHFLKGMLNGMALDMKTTSVYPRLLWVGGVYDNDPKKLRYSFSTSTRPDGKLQINVTVKGRRTLYGTDQIVGIRTCHVASDSSSMSEFNSWVVGSTTSQAAIEYYIPTQQGQTLFFTYTLQYVTDCNTIINNMSFVVKENGVALPANKTNVRSTPFFTDYTYSSQYFDFFSPLDIPRYQVAWASYLPGTDWSYVYPFINLYFYSDIDIFNTMSSTTTTLTTLPPLKAKTLNEEPFNYVLKKPVARISCPFTYGPVWSTFLRFSFKPGEWPTNAKAFALIMGEGIPAKTTPDQRANAGIFTALQTPYNPYSKNPNMMVGIDYVFNWTRA